MTGRRRELGARGEAAAKAALRRRGYRILVENFRCPLGEIDLIAEQGRVLVFIEVKARTTPAFGPPQGAVGFRKQRQIARVAEFYLAGAGHRPVACRFDVVAVTYPGEADRPHVEIIQDAFPREGIALFP